MTVSKMSVRHAISAVLKKFEIDQLDLEMELTSAVYGFFQRLENGEDEKVVQGDMLDQFTRQHSEIKYQTELIERVSKALRQNVNPDRWEKVLRFLARMEREKGQTIEKYAAWCQEDVFNSPKAHHIANRPSVIQDTWPQAFPEATQIIMQTDDGGFDF